MKISEIPRWWKELPWNKYDEPLIGFERRKKPLTWKEVFFRDKMAVLQTAFMVFIIMVLLI